MTRDPFSIVVSPKEGEGDSISGDIRRWSDGAPRGRKRRRNVSHVIRKDFALFALGFRCGQIPRLESTCVQSERSREKVGLLHFLCSDTAGREIRHWKEMPGHPGKRALFDSWTGSPVSLDGGIRMYPSLGASIAVNDPVPFAMHIKVVKVSKLGAHRSKGSRNGACKSSFVSRQKRAFPHISSPPFFS